MLPGLCHCPVKIFTPVSTIQSLLQPLKFPPWPPDGTTSFKVFHDPLPLLVLLLFPSFLSVSLSLYPLSQIQELSWIAILNGLYLILLSHYLILDPIDHFILLKIIPLTSVFSAIQSISSSVLLAFLSSLSPLPGGHTQASTLASPPSQDLSLTLQLHLSPHLQYQSLTSLCQFGQLSWYWVAILCVQLPTGGLSLSLLMALWATNVPTYRLPS